MRLVGVDFTSAPSTRKPIVAAHGEIRGDELRLLRLDLLPDWASFEALLAVPGPWLAALDFPFGLPREAVEELGWPRRWPDLVSHCEHLGRAGFRAALDAHRSTRPAGRRYAHRATDLPARSHSPLKLVNPPVGLMFLEGAPRLLAAGVSIPGMLAGDAARVAVEAYPGLLARALHGGSYKADDRPRQNETRRSARQAMLARLESGQHPLGWRLCAEPDLRQRLVDDARGDSLDAVLALVQAAWCSARADSGFGLPRDTDPLEGWIATA